MSKTLLQTSPTDVIALASDLAYPFAAATPDANGAVTLSDRTNNTTTADGTALTPSFGDAAYGGMRDLLWVVDCSSLAAAVTINWPSTVTAFDYDSSESVDKTTEAGRVVAFLLTELVSGQFVVTRFVYPES